MTESEWNFDMSAAPTDGTWIMGRPKILGYVEPEKVRWCATYEPRQNGNLLSWQNEQGHYALCIGSWKPIDG